MDIYNTLEQALSRLISVEHSKEKLQKEQCIVDQKIQWILHYIENEKINTKVSYRLIRELKILRKERRDIKNNLDQIRSFEDGIDKLKNVDSQALLLGQLRRLKNKQIEWTYTNDIYSEEEIKRILT